MSLQNRQLVSIMKYLIAVLLCLLAVALASELQIETTVCWMMLLFIEFVY
jgi:hypothetical protein